ncbi:MAG: 4-hydroxy-3-methylbut-2-enyl diphosphate reductase [Candidatus Aminicenantes bacterium]|nr:4-hydroxy-3-methylbut-2-enyl diphosphate reductase [Candidatus Aminicenantes bacterium]NIM84593.1 4-hydroxy-3-methylbut-2-enyl diphosphate reductase [Candidatus Aminicenantes bacterium]NIN24115.1 4-hydroxy-3-methylbut-2-enyl diphosphate reductase [Candidatus Aminicenantes bacterium]NIN47821.1 4-hydroxy-3-methylbut-2-enyl diphosphate reductase [Candidatus Aminicenantes bacterium]NIN90759.1 4-hydroxy-3-methylbut-2-enyl diphosphate reductase [Candidatus Aminicenantes bacterium]
MKVYVAEQAGFCFGVKRALDIIDQLYEKGHEIQIHGQLIHNPTVLENLKARGIECIDSLEQLDPSKTLIIRTHGIPKEVENNLKEKGIKYVDTTCPLVKKLQKRIEELNSQDTRIVIVGDRNHPEIIAAKSYAPEAKVINSEEEARGFDTKGSSISVVAQTTLDSNFFDKMVAILEEKTKKENLYVYDTICSATKERQEAVKKLASKVDFVVVVGGKNSSNTKKLYNIALKKNKNTIHIEKSSDLYLYQDDANFRKQAAHLQSIGITAGASTPPEEIEKVKLFFNKFKLTPDKEMNHGGSKRNANTGYEYRES